MTHALPQQGDGRRDLSVTGATWRSLVLTGLDAAAERPYWLALSGVPGVGPATFARLVGEHGSARTAWRALPEHIASLTSVAADAGRFVAEVRREGVGTFARCLEDGLRRIGADAVTALEPAYPAALAELHPRPPVLYLRGSRDALGSPAVAVVGTRRPTGYGRSVAREIADELARAGVSVVSGLAIGIDGEAHAACLDAGGRTVAVLPSPLNRVYPPRHRALADRIVAESGLLVSEQPPGRAVGRPDFARRNRIIAGLAQATVVVEAPDGSGALLTAEAALQYGRELYAVPGQIDTLAARGCNRLIADQSATIVTSALALTHQVGARRGARALSVAALSEAEGIVLAALLKRSGSIEELIRRTHLGTAPLASALTLLEARGLCTSYGGATFHATLVARQLEKSGRLG